MSVRWVLPLLIAAAGLNPAARAAEPQAEFLAATLKDLLLANVPAPLHTAKRNWDHQKEVVTGVKFVKVEGRLRPKVEAAHGLRNDGLWQKLTAEAIDPAKSLAVGVHKIAHPSPGVATFEAMVGLDVRLTLESQLWKSGVRAYSGETRSRCRVAARLACEVTNKVEVKPGSLLPDAVLRVRVTEAELFYSDLVCEHTLGLDGEPAEKLGEVVHKFITLVKPDLEKNLLAKANAAVVKAADTREVRVEFDKLLEGKPPAVTREKKK